MTLRGPKTPIDAALLDYALRMSTGRDDALDRVEQETLAMPGARMLMPPEQGLFTTMLTRIAGARRALEVGTFTGYGAISIARGLPTDGSLLCLEISPEFAELARHNLQAAGVAERVEVRVGPALESLRALPDEPMFDLVFIDADKTGYPDYYEQCLSRTLPGGLLLLDNTLQGGRVLAPEDDGAQTIDALNRAITQDSRVDAVLLPIADGLTVVRKR